MNDSQDGSQPPPAAPRAKPAQNAYSRDLPHIQNDGDTLFVTFSTRKRWVLPEHVRQAVLKHCLHDHGVRIRLHAAVVMPDHVHLIFTPLKDADGETFALATIMSDIKGAAAHTVNRALNRHGPVW
jgi:REP element-mobilizing transposase RayT